MSETIQDILSILNICIITCIVFCFLLFVCCSDNPITHFDISVDGLFVAKDEQNQDIYVIFDTNYPYMYFVSHRPVHKHSTWRVYVYKDDVDQEKFIEIIGMVEVR